MKEWWKQQRQTFEERAVSWMERYEMAEYDRVVTERPTKPIPGTFVNVAPNLDEKGLWCACELASRKFAPVEKDGTVTIDLSQTDYIKDREVRVRFYDSERTGNRGGIDSPVSPEDRARTAAAPHPPGHRPAIPTTPTPRPGSVGSSSIVHRSSSSTVPS